MSKREKLPDEAIVAFLAAHPGWERAGEALSKTFTFDSYGAGIAFVVAVGFAAEKCDHHPDLHVGWRKVQVVWSTHDAVTVVDGAPTPSSGITSLDTDLAEHSDRLAR